MEATKQTETKKQSNPYAFPQSEFNDTTHPDFNGMTLRDYFANSAMQGLLASGIVKRFSDRDIEEDVKLFYKYADAMLKQREIENI